MNPNSIPSIEFIIIRIPLQYLVSSYYVLHGQKGEWTKWESVGVRNVVVKIFGNSVKIT